MRLFGLRWDAIFLNIAVAIFLIWSVSIIIEPQNAKTSPEPLKGLNKIKLEFDYPLDGYSKTVHEANQRIEKQLKALGLQVFPPDKRYTDVLYTLQLSAYRLSLARTTPPRLCHRFKSLL